jgi:acetoin utilization deacetylase AcuC-like enzyme
MDGIAATMYSKNAASSSPGVRVPPTRGRVISLLEGGYDCAPETLGLARCVNAHVKALRGKGTVTTAEEAKSTVS